jgi:phosphoribosyl-ATP pyrophosphohydrolase
MTKTTLGAALDRLIATVAERETDADPKQSYTASLLASGPQRCAKKLGEEAIEAALAGVSGDKQALAEEAADLLFHLVVLLRACGLDAAAAAEALERRRGTSGHAEKRSRGSE